MIHLGGIIVAGAAALLYNVGVGQYGEFRTRQMAAVPALETCENATITKTSSELRRTVSPLTGLVEKAEDRCAWNTWLLSPSSAARQCSEGDRGEECSPLLAPGTLYTFAYRSYVNFEESGAIKKALFHVPTWMGFIGVRRGSLAVGEDGKSVTLTDYFRKRFTPTTITWEGTLENRREEEDGMPRIVWTSSSMVTGRGKSRETIERPSISEKLRQTPWDIIKVEDGIVGFRRGDVGMLAYAT
mmetsp:Transcript_13558/g.22570  ORF Transcript_13558/g.22570 Transcript_13558/m.22570 type:complete len:243 (-) Transcript_13558:315-1043(-)